MKAQTWDLLGLDVPSKCRLCTCIDVKIVCRPWCCTFQLLPLIRRRLPPFRLPASTDPHLGLQPFINHPVRGVLSPSCQRRGFQRGIPPCNPQRRREFDPVTNSEPFCAVCGGRGCSWWGGLLCVVSPRRIDRQAVLLGPADRPSAGCLARFGCTADNQNKPYQTTFTFEIKLRHILL